MLNVVLLGKWTNRIELSCAAVVTLGLPVLGLSAGRLCLAVPTEVCAY